MKHEKTTIQNIPIWDIQDDYYFIVINNIEINLRAYDNNSILLWLYDYDNNQEIIDDEFTSLEEITKTIQKHLKIDINLPTLEQLLKLQQGA
ncbi:MAG: hypothetical protein U9Q33_01170 [Campylobacterota bacterium]|nr:hypothetical protein [Campylobacterota bacterium]